MMARALFLGALARAAALAPKPRPRSAGRAARTAAGAGRAPAVSRAAATHAAETAVAAENPFDIMRDDLKLMKLRIRELVERTLDGGDSGGGGGGGGRSSHPLLQEAAREFFERRERAFRPAVVLLVARALERTTAGEPVPARQCLLAEIVEMMSTAQVVHDSVLEDDECGSAGNVAHRTYSQNAGNKVSVLAGDFLLARCSVALSQLGDLAVVELMATALESMVTGGVLQNQDLRKGPVALADYERTAGLKTSLIADACRSAAILAGEDAHGSVAAAVDGYARHLGLAYQVMADTIKYAAALDETERVSLLADYAATPPVILAAASDEEIRAAIDAASATRAELRSVADAVAAAGGAAAAHDLSRHYAAEAKAALDVLPESTEKRALLTMADYVSQEDQLGLQREKYIQARSKERA